jgi:transposase-like protein
LAARPKYSDEFRRRVVDKARQSGLPVARVAREFGVSPDTLRRWAKESKPRSPEAVRIDAEIERPAPLSTASDPATNEVRRTGRAKGQLAATSALLSSFVGIAWTPSNRGIGHLVHRPRDLAQVVTGLPLSLRLLGVVLGWSLTILTSVAVSAPSSVRGGAVIVHVLSLVIAFGAVVVIDWHGLLWLTGTRGLRELTRLAAAAGPLIWTGLAGLLASGAFLDPDMSSPTTWTKLTLVLAVGLNGALTSTINRSLSDLPRATGLSVLPPRLRARLITATVVSQLGWWGAIIIGFSTAARDS